MSAGFVVAAIARHDQSESDGIHLLWTPPWTAGWSIDGWDVQRRKAEGRKEPRCRQLSAAELQALHAILRLEFAFGEIRLRQADCPANLPLLPDEPADRPRPTRPAAAGGGPAAPSGSANAAAQPPDRTAAAATATASAFAATGISTGPRKCAAYDIRLPERHSIVQVRAGLPAGLAIALREGKAVDAQVLASPSGTQTARFENRDVDQVLLYCSVLATSLEVCLEDLRDPADEEAEWAGAEFVAKNLQLPLRTLDGSLGSSQEEADLAKSRLFSGEDFDEEAFEALADLMNGVAADAKEAAPVWSSTVTREEPGDPFVEVRSWSYALALLVDPAWRRMLGFSVRDKDVEPGRSYDYRVTGRFARRDVEERVHGFHAVPRGTMLPRRFALGDIALRTPEPAIVEQRPEPAADTLQASGRKGIAIAGDPGLTITFSSPVRSLVFEHDGGAGLRYRATTTDYFPGLPTNTFSGVVSRDRRVTLKFADPVHAVRLAGFGFLYAIREVLSTAGTKPDDVVTRSVVLDDVPYVDAGLPAAPLDLGTVNLQQPILPGPPAGAPPPASLGFALHWTPRPPAGAPGPVPWPADAGAAPPLEALGFDIERRRVDTNGDFEPIDDADSRTLAFGSRGAAAEAPQLGAGADLELAFPENAPPTSPVPARMSLDDVLVRGDGGPAGTGGSGPPPGSLHQYRIFSLDALGRRSATPLDGSIVRLEKRRPPPQPPGPPRDADAVIPAGVRARVLQALDPDLAAADRTLLGTSGNAVVLEWGWTQAERDRDPHATEFRVYWQPLAPDVVEGAVTGPPALAGTLFEMPATLDRPLAQDAMAGRYVSLPDYPFKIASHTAGRMIVLRVERSVLEPQRTPGVAEFTFRPVLDGSEQRPPGWAERTAVVPITGAASYRHVFRDLLTLDAEHPRARVWAGVAAADAQSYVDDALPPAAPNGGRPGNESAIAASDAIARFLGRPLFVVAPPLPNVPEVVVDEPAGDGVLVLVDLPVLLPAVSVPAGHRVQLDRIALDDIVGCMSANADGTIGAKLPGGVTSSYTLANPTDQADLVEQIRGGTPGRVENRFLMDFVLRFGGRLEPLWLRGAARAGGVRPAHRHAAAEGRAVRAPHPDRRSSRTPVRRGRDRAEGRARPVAAVAVAAGALDRRDGGRPAARRRPSPRRVRHRVGAPLRNRRGRRRARQRQPRRRPAPAAAQRARSLPRRRAAPAPRRRDAARAVVGARRPGRGRRAARPHPHDDAGRRPRPPHRPVGRDDDARRRHLALRGTDRRDDGPGAARRAAADRQAHRRYRHRELARARPAGAGRARAKPRRRAQLRAGQPVARRGRRRVRRARGRRPRALPTRVARRSRAQRRRRRGAAGLMAALASPTAPPRATTEPTGPPAPARATTEPTRPPAPAPATTEPTGRPVPARAAAEPWRAR